VPRGAPAAVQDPLHRVRALGRRRERQLPGNRAGRARPQLDLLGEQRIGIGSDKAGSFPALRDPGERRQLQDRQERGRIGPDARDSVIRIGLCPEMKFVIILIWHLLDWVLASLYRGRNSKGEASHLLLSFCSFPLLFSCCSGAERGTDQ